MYNYLTQIPSGSFISNYKLYFASKHIYKNIYAFNDHRKLNHLLNIERQQQQLMDVYTMDGRLQGCAGFIKVNRERKPNEAIFILHLFKEFAETYLTETLCMLCKIACCSPFQIEKFRTHMISPDSVTRSPMLDYSEDFCRMIERIGFVRVSNDMRRTQIRVGRGVNNLK